jgi:hypothetical protein
MMYLTTVLSHAALSFVNETKLTASNVTAGDLFGRSVAIDRDTIVIASLPDEVSVFVRAGLGWSEQQILVPSVLRRVNSVAIDGDTLVAGPFVFVRNGTTWTEQQMLVPSDEPGSTFGTDAVDISGDTIVIGAFGDGQAGIRSGSAYVFVRNGATWTQQQKLIKDGAKAEDRFGSSVAIEGDTIAVGVPNDEPDSLPTFSDRGSVRVFTRSGGTWTQQQSLEDSFNPSIGLLGAKVAISGDTVVGGMGGGAYVFVRNGNTWNKQQILSNFFFSAVAISGDSIVVGNSLDDTAGNDAGAVILFERNRTTWTEKQRGPASDTAALDNFGFSVAINGGTIVVGSPFNDNAGITNSGAAYVFERPPVQLVALEVVQSIQDWHNSVPLVENKRTYVRAHLQTDLTDFPRAAGLLHGSRGGTPLPGFGSQGDAVWRSGLPRGELVATAAGRVQGGGGGLPSAGASGQ